MRKGSGRIRALLGAVVVVALLAGAQTSSGQTPGKRITLLIWSTGIGASSPWFVPASWATPAAVNQTSTVGLPRIA